jgi:hypothetical protein
VKSEEVRSERTRRRMGEWAKGRPLKFEDEDEDEYED